MNGNLQLKPGSPERKTEDSDLTIVEAFLYGNGEERQRAFLEMVNRYRKRLYGVIFGMVHDHNETDDLLQDVFIAAFEKMHTFRMDSSLYTWLCRIAMNRSVSHLRMKKIRRALTLETVFHIADPSPRPDDVTVRREQDAILAEAVRRLPPQQKKIFVLRHMDGLSHREIAVLLGRTEGAVKAGFFHALKKIQSYVNERTAV